MDHNSEGKAGCSTMNCSNLAWWATLLIAVLAVPSVGIIVVTVLHVEGMMAIAIFMLACWFSTYLGMRLMSDPKMAERLGKK